MLGKIKKNFYFPVAWYFRFFAAIRLRRWHPKIIVITGSSGKTTILHLLEAQIGTAARYSHHANSSFGIPFDILGLHRKSLLKTEWVSLFLKAPFAALKSSPKEKMYVVEADCDRPDEGKFLGSFLKPEMVLWLNVSRTHSMNFDALVSQKKFRSVDEAIAYEYGYFLEFCKEIAYVNGDSELIIKQTSRTKAQIKKITKKEFLQNYDVSTKGTKFVIQKQKFTFTFLLPVDTFYSLVACNDVLNSLDKKVESSYKHFKIPPGRSSLFKGIRETTIVDSSYNANLISMGVILDMFEKMQTRNKWAILGDMLEQGEEEKEEHEKLAALLTRMKVDRVLLMGPRVSKYTYPALKDIAPRDMIIEKFLTPKEVLDYLLKHLSGGETLLFKGARFLEGVIEHLLSDKKDVSKLCRREKIWEIRRKKWGL